MSAPIKVTLTGCYTAAAAGITVDYEKRSRGSPICALARKLAAAGYDPNSMLNIYRDGTLCFRPLPLSRWAGLSVSEGDDSDRAAHFARYRPPPSKRALERRCSGGFSGLLDSAAPRIPENANAALTAGGAQ